MLLFLVKEIKSLSVINTSRLGFRSIIHDNKFYPNKETGTLARFTFLQCLAQKTLLHIVRYSNSNLRIDEKSFVAFKRNKKYLTVTSNSFSAAI